MAPKNELLHRQSTIMLASMLTDVIEKLVEHDIISRAEKDEMVRKAASITDVME